MTGAEQVYPLLAPLLLSAMPTADASHMRASDLWVKAGSPGSMSAVKSCLRMLQAEGVIDCALDDRRPGPPANAYRFKARAKVEEESLT